MPDDGDMAILASPGAPVRPIDVRGRLRRDLPWIGAFAVVTSTVATVALTRFGWDSHAYWLAASGATYTSPPGTADAYLYSPAFAQAIRPLALLPWPVFAALWSLAAGLTLALLLRPLGWRRAVPLWLCCSIEIVSGNIFWLLALVAAFGLRFPVLWMIPALTKVTPALGPVWFLVRREWRQLAVAVTSTAAVAGTSYLVEPDAWRDWYAFLGTHAEGATGQVGAPSLPLVIRVPLALLLVAWGARGDRRWTIPAGMVLASPVAGLAGLVVLAALPLLYGPRGQRPESVPAG